MVNHGSYVKRLQELELESPFHFVFSSFSELTPRANTLSKTRWGLCLLASFLLSCSAFQMNCLQDILLACLSLIIDVELGILGILFTVFSIVFIFVSSTFLKETINVENEHGVGAINDLVIYFGHLLCLYAIALFISVLLYLFVSCCSFNIPFLDPSMEKHGQEAVAILYLTFTLRLFIELRSSIYNLVLLAHTAMATKYSHITKTDQKNRGNAEEPSR